MGLYLKRVQKEIQKETNKKGKMTDYYKCSLFTRKSHLIWSVSFFSEHNKNVSII